STPSGAMVSLGRGGSDLSAVRMAAAVGAACCELIKDVPGYFTSDPAVDPEARHIPVMHVDAAIEMARAGCGLVQAAALDTARALGVRLIVRASGADARYTVVFTEGDRHAIRHENDSRRAAVGA
ncbi:MAG: aspartate kinase, partial [Acidobacteriota bacterium]|nr:aspartate kinase [Acidobacteriota bacterium]